MDTIGKGSSNEITARDLLVVLARLPDSPLLFIYDGATIRPGYHVTEVKTGRFTSLDCGANAEAWTETFIQLWDIDEADRSHMTAGKFTAIIDKVAKLSALDPDTKLTFEVSDGEQAMRLFKAANLQIDDHRVVVSLGQRPASCKPRDRWLSDTPATPSCCAPASADACCAAPA